MTLVVQAAPGTLTGTVVMNNVSGSLVSGDPNAANNGATTTTTVGPISALTVVLAGSGGGSVVSSVGTMNCPSTCVNTYPCNVLVTLSATPAAGSTFLGWLGGGCMGRAACGVTMNAAKTVTDCFALTRSGPFTLNIDLTDPNTK